MLPNNATTDFINEEFGLMFHSDSAFLRGMVDRGDHHLAFAVERSAAPVDAACVARGQDRAAQARRCEDSVGTIARDQIATPAAIVESEPPGVLRGHGRMR